MDIAIVTGASSEIGLAISRKLVEIGCRVYGLGGDFSNINYSHRSFIPTSCDLSRGEEIKEKVEGIIAREGNIFILVNNAKYFGRTPFLEAIDLTELETILKINLFCPLLLARLALPTLKQLQGFIINIAPSSTDLSKGGPAGAAAAGGLRWLGEALFEECREFGVKVTTVFPQSNRPRPSEAVSSSVKNPQTVINTEAIAEAVERVIMHPDGNVITEIVIRPQRLKSKPIPPPLYIPYPEISKEAEPAKASGTVRSLAGTRAAIKKAVQKTRNKITTTSEKTEVSERRKTDRPTRAKRKRAGHPETSSKKGAPQGTPPRQTTSKPQKKRAGKKVERQGEIPEKRAARGPVKKKRPIEREKQVPKGKKRHPPLKQSIPKGGADREAPKKQLAARPGLEKAVSEKPLKPKRRRNR